MPWPATAEVFFFLFLDVVDDSVLFRLNKIQVTLGRIAKKRGKLF